MSNLVTTSAEEQYTLIAMDDGKANALSFDMLQQRLLVNNPRDVNYDDALAIYRGAYQGAA